MKPTVPISQPQRTGINPWWRVFLVIMLIVSVIITILFLAPKSPIPVSIKSQLAFVPLSPQSSVIKVDHDTIKYDPDSKVLSYSLDYTHARLTVTEQPTPQYYGGSPQTYDKMTEEMGSYSSFDSAIGTVHLTRSNEAGSRQEAVLNAQGTLMFVRSNKDLSVDQWKFLFRHVKVDK